MSDEETRVAAELLELPERHHETLQRLGADFEPSDTVGARTSRPNGWVVVAVDQLLNLKPSVTAAYGPFPTEQAARAYSANVTENGTRLFIAALTNPARYPAETGEEES